MGIAAGTLKCWPELNFLGYGAKTKIFLLLKIAAQSLRSSPFMFAFLQELSASALEIGVKHGHWLAPASFAFAFIKSLPFVSLLVPGTAALLSIGVLIGAGKIAFLPVWIAVSIGAGLGDWVSYRLGRRYGPRILTSKWVQRRTELYTKTKKFFDRWGWMSIALCRFIGPLRATIPMAAGIFEMPRRSFHLANWLSAFLWASALLLPGWAGFKLM